MCVVDRSVDPRCSGWATKGGSGETAQSVESPSSIFRGKKVLHFHFVCSAFWLLLQLNSHDV